MLSFHEWVEKNKIEENLAKRTVPLRKTVGGKHMPPLRRARWKSPPVVGGDTPKTSTSSLPGETVDTYVKRVGKDVERPEDSSEAGWEKFQNQLKRL